MAWHIDLHEVSLHSTGNLILSVGDDEAVLVWFERDEHDPSRVTVFMQDYSDSGWRTENKTYLEVTL